MTSHCEPDPPTRPVEPGLPRIALVGSPNAGKTTLFNRLTGLHGRTGNYPGVTVARYVGSCRTAGGRCLVEDLPGTYGLEAVSPDEQVVSDTLAGRLPGSDVPDALLLTVDATTLRRSLLLVAEVLGRGLPVCVVLTFGDELARGQGGLDDTALSRALGVPVVRVLAHRGEGIVQVRERLADWRTWPTPVVAPPLEVVERDAWVESVLDFAGYRPPQRHRPTQRVDAVLLHPVSGTVVFLAVMAGFFQVVFSLGAPMQRQVALAFAALAGLVSEHVGPPWAQRLLGDALLGGVGGVLAFVPQIMLLFLLLALLEGVGYLSRAAFLMDRVMARAGLEGRAFVALLSSMACAVPGILAARTLPTARERLATMLAAPLMTCSARLPVYLLLIGLLVDPAARVGPFGVQGLVMFGLYLTGGMAAMTGAWLVTRVTGRGRPGVVAMEMPPYRVPSARTVVLAMWSASQAFVRKCATIILTTTVLLWLLLNLPLQSTAALSAAGVDTADPAAVAAATIDHSYAAGLGRLAGPVFEPLGFDWRITVGVLSAQSARETFVATLGQVASASAPDDPATTLRGLRVESGPRTGQPLFSAPTVAALLAWFVFALQCTATVGVLVRETGGWRWPLLALGGSTVTAWVVALATRCVVALLTGEGWS